MKKHAKYQKLFDDSIDGYALADTKTGILTESNQALADLVERSKDEIIGRIILYVKPEIENPPFVIKLT